MNKEEFIDYLYSLDPSLSLGVHGIGKTRDENNASLSTLDIANKITKEGLKTRGGWGLLGTIATFGQIGNLNSRELKQIMDYCYMAEEERIVNVLFAFPESITTSDGENLYLGHYDDENEFNKKHGKYSEFPLNELTQRLGYVPKEFIVGYYITKFDSDDFTFIKNPDFYQLKNNGYEDRLRDLLKENQTNSAQEIMKIQELFIMQDHKSHG